MDLGDLTKHIAGSLGLAAARRLRHDMTQAGSGHPLLSLDPFRLHVPGLEDADDDLRKAVELYQGYYYARMSELTMALMKIEGQLDPDLEAVVKGLPSWAEAPVRRYVSLMIREMFSPRLDAAK